MLFVVMLVVPRNVLAARAGHTPVVLGAIMEQRDHGIPEALSSCADTDCAPELLKQVPADAMVTDTFGDRFDG